MRSACPLLGRILSRGARFIAEPQHKKWFDPEMSSASGVPTSSRATASRPFQEPFTKKVSSAQRRCAR